MFGLKLLTTLVSVAVIVGNLRVAKMEFRKLRY